MENNVETRESSGIDSIRSNNVTAAVSSSFIEEHAEDDLPERDGILCSEKIETIAVEDEDQKLTEINTKSIDAVEESTDEQGGSEEMNMNTNFLDDWETQHRIVDHNAEDSPHVECEGPRTIAHHGKNCAGAVKIGSNKWDRLDDLGNLCFCDLASTEQSATTETVEFTLEVTNLGRRPAWHQCETCERFFRNKNVLTAHEESEHGKTSVCPTCGKVFRQSQSLQRHKRLGCSEDNSGKRVENKSCPICGKTVRHLARHKLEQHKHLEKCSGCQISLSRHELSIHKKECIRFMCIRCLKIFKTSRALTVHKQRWCNNKLK